MVFCFVAESLLSNSDAQNSFKFVTTEVSNIFCVSSVVDPSQTSLTQNPLVYRQYPYHPRNLIVYRF